MNTIKDKATPEIAVSTIANSLRQYTNDPLRARLSHQMTVELRHWLQERLPDYMVPATFVMLDEIPLTPNGKVNRQALPPPDGERPHQQVSYTPPRTLTEELSARIWAGVLGLERVGIHDNFFDLGGHSLLAIQTISRIRSAFNIEFPLRCLFDEPTIAQTASTIEKALQARTLTNIEPIKRVHRAGDLPLSFAQERLWFLNQLDPDSPAYNIPAVVRMKGELNVEAVEESLNLLVARHESLRTTFSSLNQSPRQIIHPAFAVKLQLFDLSSLDPSDREYQLRQLASQESARAFALTQGPLLRASLIKLQEVEHVLVLVMHHIVSDGWSAGILIRELGELYQAKVEGRPSRLGELAVQYGDYAVWQREWLEGEALDSQLAFWKETLRGSAEVLQLPADRPRPAVQSFRGGEVSFQISPALKESLEALSIKEGATLFMTLLAAYQSLLWRYTGQNDINVGVPVAGRQLAETEGLIGFFVNTLVMRGVLSEDLTFRQFLKQMREVVLGAFAHQELPFQSLIEALHPERSLSHAPLVQVTFTLQNAPQEEIKLPGLTLEPMVIDRGKAEYDLSMVMWPEAEGMSGVLVYSADIFEPRTVKQIANHFQRLLEQIVTIPDRLISLLPLLTEAEWEEIVVGWNNTAQPYPHELTVHSQFEYQSFLFPHNIALISNDVALSYLELNQRANQLAHYLLDLGVGRDSVVAIALERSEQIIIAILAVLKAGGAYLAIDTSYPLERTSYMLGDGQVGVVVTDREGSDKLPAGWLQVISLDEDRELISSFSVQNPETNVLPDNAAYVSYTSGSTGTPKGVVVCHRAILRLLMGTDYVALGRDRTLLHLSPLAFDASTFEIWGALLHGGRCVLLPERVPTPQALQSVIRRHGVNTVWLTASLFNLVMDELPEALAGVEQLLVGGEALSVPHINRALDLLPTTKLINGYGPTEGTTFTCCYPLPRDFDGSRGSVPIGKPIANTKVYLLDRQLNPVPIGVPGELYIGGDGLARGYLNKPELTAANFISDPFSKKGGERLYKTGDQARYRPDGAIEFLGRIDNQVKVRGFRIELSEIEIVLTQHPAIKQAVAEVWKDGPAEKRIVVYLVADEQLQPSVNELRRYLADRLPEYMVPAAFVWLDTLPFLESGKVDRRSLPAPEQSRVGLEETFIAPRTENEETLAEIWAEVLGLDQVGIRDNFFDLGGDSIRSIQVVAKCNSRSLNISLQQIFQHPTIEELAQALESSSNTIATKQALQPFSLISESDLRRIPDGIEDAYPITRLQAGMMFHTEYSPESAVYHDIFSFHIKAPLDVEAMRSTIELMIARHAILRTSFDLLGFSEPLQLVNRIIELPLEIHDLRHQSSEKQDEVIAERFEAEKKRGFNWNKAPLLRVEIYQRDEQSFQLLVSFHHAILDGWSLSTLLAEMFHHYLFLLGKETQALAPPPAQSFRDFVHLERQAIKSEESKHFWSEMLAGASLTRLPRWPSGESERTRRINLIDTLLSPEIIKGLTKLAASLGVPIKTVLLALHFRVLGWFGGQNDVVAGVVTHGRPEEADGERILGLFLNTLPFRLTLTSGTWDDLVRQTFELEQEILPHRRYPLADLQQTLGDDSLFETIFDFTHFHVYKALPQLKDLEVLSGQSFAETNFTLVVHFNLDPLSSALHLILIYDESQIRAEQAKSMSDCYNRALAVIASTPSSRHDLLLPFSEAEREEIVVRWNNTEHPYPLELTLPSLFEYQTSMVPDNIALICNDLRLTHRELNQRANQLAHYLLDLGVGKDSLVAISLDRSEHMIIAILAVLKAGGAYLGIDASNPLDRTSYMLRDGRIGVVVTDRERGNKLPAGWMQVVLIDEDRDLISSLSVQNPETNVSSHNLAYVIYTSGSTGRPKGVMIEHSSVVNLARWQAETFNISSHSRILQFFSYSFDGAVGETFMALLNGATLVMADRENLDPEKLVQVINEQKISVAVLVPSLIKQLDVDKFEHPDEIQIVSVGEACPSEMALRWASKCRFINAYGPTEYTVYSHLWQVTKTGIRESNCVPIGKPIHNTKTFILDKRLLPVPVGVPGEIYISGAGLARGYLNQPEETAARFLPNPFNHNHRYQDHGTISLDSAAKQIADFLESHNNGASDGKSSREEEIKKLTPYLILKFVECLDADLVQKTRSIISDYGDSRAIYDCFVRYFLEGAKDEYASCGINEELLKFFLFENFRDLKGIDFCFGNAEVLRMLAHSGARVKGIDFSPFFVQRARNRGLDAYMTRADIPFDQLSKECGIEEASQDFVLTTLSLDRVGNPKNLLRNMFACLKENGRFAIQTLLPILSIDDGKVDAPITYTPEQNRLTAGESADRDKKELIALLFDMGADDLNICRMPYAVTSTDGVQEYVMWSFFGAKRSSRSSVFYNNTYSRMYRTGDLGRYLPDGNIEFLGRSDYQVKIRGFRIELEGIEAVIEQHPAVRQAVVMTNERGAGDPRLVAYLVAEPGCNCSVDELRAFIKDQLPDYMRPSSFVLVDSLPTTQSGKIDRLALSAPDSSPLSEESIFIPPRTMIEEVLGGIFAQVLGLQRVSIHDNFFDLGGHSLLATQVISRVRNALQVELLLRSLFDAPTVAELARVIEKSDGRDRDLNALLEEKSLPILEPASTRDNLPLSFAQERLWFLDQLEPGSSIYNVAAAIRLIGPLDLAALEASINHIIARHESLRTTVDKLDGVSFQLIHQQMSLTLKVEDLTLLPEADCNNELNSIINRQAQEPFDLQHGPLLRVGLFRLAEREHVALLTMHHIVSDGWSMGVLIDEIASLYEAHTNGQAPKLPELSVQYGDYAVWQREWLKGDVLETQLAYWKHRLAEAPSGLQLPTDRPRPPVQSHRGGLLSLTLSPQLTSGLELLSRSEDATLFMTLLAAFNVLLNRYGGQEDIMIGSPVANRNRSEIEGLIGFFVNTLVVRTDLSGNPTFRELLARVRQTAIEAFDHQDVPFEKVVDELKLERDMSRNPLFQVMFAMQNAPTRKLNLRGLTLEELPLETETARFDLVLVTEKIEDRLSASIEYSSDLFDEATIARMLDHLERLLQAIVTDPSQRIADLPLLTDAEHEQIIAVWNDTLAAYDRHACIHKLFEAQVDRSPNQIALVSSQQRVSYQLLDARANQVARYLLELGIKPEDRVGICMDRSIDMVTAILGVLKAGGVYVPLDPDYPQQRLAYMLGDSKAQVLVTQNHLVERVDCTGVQVVILDADNQSIIRQSQNRPESTICSRNLAYVIYTSGSTGQPKGVAIEHRSAVALLDWAKRVFRESDLASVLASTSICFDLSVFEIFAPLCTGGKAVLASNALDLLSWSDREEISLINTVPSVMAEIVRKTQLPNTVKIVNLAGEVLNRQLVEDLYRQIHVQRVVNLYGPSEDTTYSTCEIVENGSEVVTIGRPVSNTQVYILDQSMNPVPVGAAGELYIAGDGLARGYLERAALTAEKFLPNPFSREPGARLYRTGDEARYLPDGRIDFVGRLDQQVKIRGFRIELGEIETALRDQSSVREAVVEARGSEADKHLVAYLVPSQDGAIDLDQLRRDLSERLPVFMLPSRFALLDELPLTPNGKVDRRALLDADSTIPDRSSFIAPRDLLEMRLVRIWEDVLGTRPVGVKDNFFDLGGHSLLAVRLIAVIEKEMRIKVPLASLFQGATVESLARLLHTSERVTSSLVPIRVDGGRPPIFFIHPVGGNIIAYAALARRLPSDQPVYGLQSRALFNEQEAHAFIEEMAAHYLEEILEIQPHGPYFLAGWSMGGVIAFEMARQLEQREERTALLALIDSYLPVAIEEIKQEDEGATVLAAFAREMGLWPNHFAELWPQIKHLGREEQLASLYEHAKGHDLLPAGIEIEQLRSLLHVFEINSRALEDFAPQPFSGQIILFRATESASQTNTDETLSWSQLARQGVELHSVAGDHYQIIAEPAVKKIADVLAMHLNQAQPITV